VQQQIVGYLGYTGRATNMVAMAAQTLEPVIDDGAGHDAGPASVSGKVSIAGIT
jgi:hypothetical protein